MARTGARALKVEAQLATAKAIAFALRALALVLAISIPLLRDVVGLRAVPEGLCRALPLPQGFCLPPLALPCSGSTLQVGPNVAAAAMTSNIHHINIALQPVHEV